MKATIGLDYGTNSVRSLVVCCETGNELGTATLEYPSGHQGVIIDAQDANLARQHPGDYLVGIETTVIAALQEAQANHPEFSPEQVVGIGVDTTGSSPIPVDAENRALAMMPEWTDNPNAQCWLWKDHTSISEALTITETAREHRPEYVAKCGNTYSSEWFWSKIWHCLNVDEAVFDAAYSWVELADWVPAQLAGISDPVQIKRGVCMAGHKALYADDWKGLPDKEFLSMLNPKLADLRDRLYEKAYDASNSAGNLCTAWAEKLGLTAGIPLAIGEMDVHYGAIGCGIDEGTLVKVIGTSTCDCGVVHADKEIADIPGICGIVKGAILPGYYGVEAGQSAVGDIFKWWVEVVCKSDSSLHAKLEAEVASMKPGESGLLALDWNNGNRTILVDPLLTGLLMGQTLHTTRAEIHRALVEATAFGARAIVERIAEYGVPINQIVCAGGIAEKSSLLMQIYADVTGREMRVASSSQTCALGAAVGAAVVAGIYPDYKSATDVMTSLKDIVYKPNPEAHEVYTRLFKLYVQLQDAFGGVTDSAALGNVMKDLLEIKNEARKTG